MRTRKPKVGNTVWVLLRLSTVADAERGFALKFYTEEDNWTWSVIRPGSHA
jgi:catalase